MFVFVEESPADFVYSVRLEKAEPPRINVVKVLYHELSRGNLSRDEASSYGPLWYAMQLTDNAPVVIAESLPLEKAKRLQEELVRAGAEVSVIRQ